MQLQLQFWPPNSVRGVLEEYLLSLTRITEDTQQDYQVRKEWLCREFGELTPASSITFARLYEVARRNTAPYGLLANVTVKRRFTFLRSALLFAKMMDVVSMSIPELPKLPSDGVEGKTFYTTAQFREFAMALPPTNTRRFAQVAFWTGMHTYDITRLTWEMLLPDDPYLGDDGVVIEMGKWLRKNHKNRKCQPAWFPMAPEFRQIVLGWLAEDQPVRPDKRVVGTVHNLSRLFYSAAERVGLPRVAPNTGLRRSCATRLAADGWKLEYVRMVLGHQGGWDELNMRARKPTIAEQHYMRMTPALAIPLARAH